MSTSPAFGQADLSNCERELIHLAGSVQPHGVLLVLRESDLRVVQVSENVETLLGVHSEALLRQLVAELGGDILLCIQQTCAQNADLSAPAPLRCSVSVGGTARPFEGALHRITDATGQRLLLVELEPVAAVPPHAETVDLSGAALRSLIGDAVRRFSAASTVGTLADSVVRSFKELLGYDRVMVYKFDPDGHGKIIAEARNPRLEPLLGHHYPATDIPQRARELYLKTRLRVLVNVHYVPSALVPRRVPPSGPGPGPGPSDDLDMSMCALRSMSPLHLQYLKNMGVTATLVVSLVREGALWGLIACHHDSPRNLRFAVRAAADLLAEVTSTRIAAIENYAQAQVAIQVRRLEQRLIEATSTEGDWRLALFRNPRTLLQPLEATGAALFHEGELLSAGEAPSTAELRALLQWVDGQQIVDRLFSCSSVSRANPALDMLTPTASGVLAVKLSASKPDYLMWFRKEQLQTVTWAGNPSKPMVASNPLELSPRSSFAAWSEIVRGTALPWSHGEIALGRAFGASLVDIIVQVNAVRLLIAEHQLSQVRATVRSADEPVLIADAHGRALFSNEAFDALLGHAGSPLPDDLATLFTETDRVRRMLAALHTERQPWRGELALQGGAGPARPVSVRAEVVTGRDGSVLGSFLIVIDLTELRRATAARAQLEQSLSAAVHAAAGSTLKPNVHVATGSAAGPAATPGEASPGTAGPAGQHPSEGDVLSAILANASLAAMDIADGSTTPAVAPLLQELEDSTRRATALYARIRLFEG